MSSVSDFSLYSTEGMTGEGDARDGGEVPRWGGKEIVVREEGVHRRRWSVEGFSPSHGRCGWRWQNERDG